MSHYSGLCPSQLHVGLIRRPKIKQNGSDCGDEEDDEETMHDDFFKSKTFRGTCIICDD